MLFKQFSCDSVHYDRITDLSDVRDKITSTLEQMVNGVLTDCKLCNDHDAFSQET